MERIADHLLNRTDELLPWNVASSLPSTAHVEPIRQHRAPVVNDLRYGAGRVLTFRLPKVSFITRQTP
ncbi:hypothetical protein L0Z36_26050 [Burkholderia multivorans]|nr:hypothetical protein [Burkholderia multivorans]UQP04362.1 hypothetical protein L0Z36_26050 [Burkholderia multivorans]